MPPEGRTSGLRRAFDWTFRDRRTGAVTIAQAPNLSLWLFGIASLAEWLLRPTGPTGPTGAAIRAAAALCLAWWALDELLRGVNPWRRGLGAAVLVYEAWQAYLWLG